MEAARLCLGDFDLEAAFDPHRGLLVLRVADVEAVGGALLLPSPPRSPSASPAHPRADVQPGCAVIAAARRKRHQTYPELARARRCRLVVVGVETGGRFGTETVQLLRLLARHKASAVPAASRPAAITGWVARWSGLLAVAAQRAFAASLLELPPAAELGEGPEPELHELLAETRWVQPCSGAGVLRSDGEVAPTDGVGQASSTRAPLVFLPYSVSIIFHHVLPGREVSIGYGRGMPRIFVTSFCTLCRHRMLAVGSEAAQAKGGRNGPATGLVKGANRIDGKDLALASTPAVVRRRSRREKTRKRKRGNLYVDQGGEGRRGSLWYRVESGQDKGDWSQGWPPPPGMAELGDEVWRGDLCPEQRGIVVLGTPIGHQDFVQAWAARRLKEEERLLSQLPKLPDLQCSWLLLLLCASPRANHALRTVPPLEIQAYARAHDQAIWHTLKQCLGGAAEAEAPHAKTLATLPAHLGGLGIQSAERASPAAYWAGLADALPVIQARLPAFAERYQAALESGGGDVPSLRAAADSRELLQAEGQGWRPAQAGEQSSKEPARSHQSTPAPATGRMDGSFTRRAPATNTFATSYYCRL
ncbi:hypothetical protein AK812_SmicGene35526 [Symbiodinium microadriaticum]|uniref:Uncharacterized protein n=1 Tax=Symbiodinium microadriaticum TaxID=2951 RepID=A0A1Q9CL92_SYMMI|nr:hypothetical protein AK812_SmicGene35526 [Symbiodinium microadriaticum]